MKIALSAPAIVSKLKKARTDAHSAEVAQQPPRTGAIAPALELSVLGRSPPTLAFA